MHLCAFGCGHDVCGEWRISAATRGYVVDAGWGKARHAQHRKRAVAIVVFLPCGGHHGGDTRAGSFFRKDGAGMSCDVLCLRPEADFQRADALPPASLRVVYRGPSDADVPQLIKQARALVIPAVGPKLAPDFFEGTTVRFVQVTG